MKRLTFLLAFALVYFYGCQKQESIPADDQQVEESGDFAYVLNNDNESLSWEVVALSELQSNSGSSTLKQSNSAHTHGDFVFGLFSLSWSGTQNNGGTHGSGVFEQTLGPPFNATVHITLDTECVMVEGDEAVYGGTFTEVLNNPFPPGGPFEVGNIIYFKVIDNGQGNNTPPDQHSVAILIFPAGNSACGSLTPGNPFWTNFPVMDVAEPGSVKVN